MSSLKEKLKEIFKQKDEKGKKRDEEEYLARQKKQEEGQKKKREETKWVWESLKKTSLAKAQNIIERLPRLLEEQAKNLKSSYSIPYSHPTTVVKEQHHGLEEGQHYGLSEKEDPFIPAIEEFCKINNFKLQKKYKVKESWLGGTDIQNYKKSSYLIALIIVWDKPFSVEILESH